MQLSPIPPQAKTPVIIPDDRPVYRINDNGPFFGPDDTLYKEGEIIAWAGQPSLCMDPLNGMARDETRKYLQMLDNLGRAAAEKVGRSYSGMSQALDNALEMERLSAKQVQVIGGADQKAVLGRPRKKGPRVEVIAPDGDAPMTGAQSRGKLSLRNRDVLNAGSEDTGLEGKGPDG